MSPFGTPLEECAFEGLGVCSFMHNFNQDTKPGWVECTLCGQWVHDICMGVEARKYGERDDFPCGCDALRDGRLNLRK